MTLHAVILAAGVGRRLGAGEADGGVPAEEQAARAACAAGKAPASAPALPKVLLRFDGRSLLERHLRILRGCGISKVTLVLGFQAQPVRDELQALGAQDVSVVVNPRFAEGSVVSLHAADAVLRSGAPVLLMDADVLYDSRLMRRLVDSDRPDCLLLDRAIEPGDEPVKLCVADGRIVDFRKKPVVAHDWHGESVGFFRLSPPAAAELAGRAADYVASGRSGLEYEEPIRDMIIASLPDRFGFEDISGLPWTEIDFPGDVERARAMLGELQA